MIKKNDLKIEKKPLGSNILNSSVIVVALTVILNKIMATESFNKPSPKIIECNFGNFFHLITDKIETVSVAVKVAESNKTFYITVGSS